MIFFEERKKPASLLPPGALPNGTTQFVIMG